MKIQLMCIAYWIPTATNRHSEYVISILFPLQIYLHESPSKFRYTYNVSLVGNRISLQFLTSLGNFTKRI